MGSHCRALHVTLRIGALEEGRTSLDHEATWLLGHTEHVSFGELWDDEGDLYVDAVIHVSCRFLADGPAGASCRAHGFRGPARASRQPPQPRQLGRNRFVVVDRMRRATRVLPPAPPAAPARRALPVLAAGATNNPCATARCTTADHARGAACCRDLQVEIMCTRLEEWLEALVRTRRSPYLCKVVREGDFSIEAEIISACGYLEAGGVNCTLHGRRRADGRPAKPDLCSDWPPKRQELHPGCVFARPRRR